MKRLTFVLGIAAAFGLVLYAGWRLHRWRQAEKQGKPKPTLPAALIEKLPRYSKWTELMSGRGLRCPTTGVMRRSIRSTEVSASAAAICSIIAALPVG